MDTKFTPGKWYSKDSRNIFAENGLHIATASGGLPHGPIEIRANTHLISAAPDLLEALREAQGMMYAQDMTATPIYILISAAIAKALGEQ